MNIPVRFAILTEIGREPVQLPALCAAKAKARLQVLAPRCPIYCRTRPVCALRKVYRT